MSKKGRVGSRVGGSVKIYKKHIETQKKTSQTIDLWKSQKIASKLEY